MFEKLQGKFEKLEGKRIANGYKLAVLADGAKLDAVYVPPDARTFEHKDQTYVMDDGTGSPYVDGSFYITGHPNPIKLVVEDEDADVDNEDKEAEAGADDGGVGGESDGDEDGEDVDMAVDGETVVAEVDNPEVLGSADSLGRVVGNEIVAMVQNDLPDPREATLWDNIPDEAYTYGVPMLIAMIGILGIVLVWMWLGG